MSGSGGAWAGRDRTRVQRSFLTRARVASIVRSIVEVFTFFQMGGELQRVDIVPLGAAIDFNRFAVEHAKCFDANDKAKLLTAIESAFGAYGPFNAIVRQLLTSASGKAADTPVKWAKRHRSSKRGVGRWERR